MTDDQLRKLFMKIDANSNGLIDWDEFSTYMMFEHEGRAIAKTKDVVCNGNEFLRPTMQDFTIAQRPNNNSPHLHTSRTMLENIIHMYSQPHKVDCFVTSRYVMCFMVNSYHSLSVAVMAHCDCGIRKLWKFLKKATAISIQS